MRCSSVSQRARGDLRGLGELGSTIQPPPPPPPPPTTTTITIPPLKCGHTVQRARDPRHHRHRYLRTRQAGPTQGHRHRGGPQGHVQGPDRAEPPGEEYHERKGGRFDRLVSFHFIRSNPSSHFPLLLPPIPSLARAYLEHHGRVRAPVHPGAASVLPGRARMALDSLECNDSDEIL